MSGQMKYLIWFARILFGAWMVTNGLNHFVYLWPQPLGGLQVSKEFTIALIDSHLFDLVKAVEVLAGVSALTGLYAPLLMIVGLPVSFVVWYYGAVINHSAGGHGYVVLGTNLIICLGYWKNYKAIFTMRTQPREIAPAMAPAPAE